MTPEALLELFSVSTRSKGGAMFCALVWLMIDGKDGTPGMDAPHAVAQLCKAAHMPRPAVYSIMKKALAPVFEAAPETLKALGLRPQSSTVGLAHEIIRSIKGGEADGGNQHARQPAKQGGGRH